MSSENQKTETPATEAAFTIAELLRRMNQDQSGSGDVLLELFLSDSANLSKAITSSLEHVERTREKMRKDHEEIDRLKTETRAMIARMLAA